MIWTIHYKIECVFDFHNEYKNKHDNYLYWGIRRREIFRKLSKK